MGVQEQAAAGAGASILGGLGGMGQEVDSIDPGAANSVLQQGLEKALPYTERYTEQAIQAQNQYFDKAITFLNSSLDKALNVSTQQFNVSQALQAPYRNAGYAALDRYMDTLMLPHTALPSQQLAAILQKDAMSQGAMANVASGAQNLNQIYNAVDPNNPYASPNAPKIDDFTGKITDAQKQNYVAQNSRPYNAQSSDFMYTGAGAYSGPGYGSGGADPSGKLQPPGFGSYVVGSPGTVLGDRGVNDAVAKELAKPYLDEAQRAYQQQQGTLFNANQSFRQYSPDQQRIALAYNRGLFNAPQMKNVGY